MGKGKKLIKQLFYLTGTTFVLDKILYIVAGFKYRKMNKIYKLNNKNIAFPPDYYLYETYKLNYKEYIEDGKLAASEIIEWTGKYKKKEINAILEWGCGVSRIVRHMSEFVDEGTEIHACDINQKMIDWNIAYIGSVSFAISDYLPPINYTSDKFDLIYAISVFTHIDASFHQAWLSEIYRILKKGGIFLFTTHGSNFLNKLRYEENKLLNERGFYTKTYYKKGHRMMTAYNKPEEFKKWLSNYFDILEFYEGRKYKEKVGGQDLWIVRKQ